MKFSVKILHPKIKPEDLKPKTPGSAGIDLVAASFPKPGCTTEIILPGETIMIGTGIAVHIKDPGYAGVVLPRSGLGNKGLVLGNLVGLIDSDYQGELKVSAWNRSNKSIPIALMDRIAQLIFVPILVPEFEVVENFSDSERGAGGFGSTGISGSLLRGGVV